MVYECFLSFFLIFNVLSANSTTFTDINGPDNAVISIDDVRDNNVVYEGSFYFGNYNGCSMSAIVDNNNSYVTIPLIEFEFSLNRVNSFDLDVIKSDSNFYTNLILGVSFHLRNTSANKSLWFGGSINFASPIAELNSFSYSHDDEYIQDFQYFTGAELTANCDYYLYLTFTPMSSVDYNNYQNNTTDYYIGYDVGYDDGYDNGYDVGHNVGYQEGQSDQLTFFSLLMAVVDTPIVMMRSLFNFDLFGVNFFLIVLSLLTLTFVLYLIKKLL